MNEVIIRIIDTANNVKGDLELANFNDFPLAINKGIVNLDNLKQRTGTFTKSFKVPNTKTNADLLSNVDNINSRKDYRRALNRKPCIILVNNSPIEKGFLQVSKVFNGLEVESFELVFYGNNIDWVKEASELTLKSITWDNNTQTYNEAGIDAANAADSTTYSHAYPYINRGGNLSTNDTIVSDYRPVFYLESVLNKCFASLGYNVNTSFFTDNAHLKKLVCDFDLKFKQDETTIENTSIWVKSGSNFTLSPGDVKRLPFDTDSASPLKDPGNNYDTSTFEYTVPSDGTYDLFYEIRVRTNSPFNGGQNVYLYIVNNGQTLTSIGTGTIIEQQVGDAYSGTIFYPVSRSTTIAARANDKISIYIETKTPESFFDVEVQGLTDRQTFLKLSKKNAIEENDNFLLNNLLPDSIKFIDVLNDFTRMFNIYYWTDVKSKTVYFNTRDSFFKAQSDAIDWTDKIDVNSYEVDYVSSYKRTLNFRYKPLNRDEWLKGWQDDNKRIYGSYNNVLSDRFTEGTQKIELDEFSAAYAITDGNAAPVNANANDYPVTLKIWNEYEDTAPETRTTNYNSKIYFFQNGNQLNVTGENNKISKFGTTTEVIPYGIFESYNNITSPQNLSFTGSDGLFSTYYSKMIKNIEEGGRLIAYFNLSSTDIENLDFRKLIYLDNEANVKGYYFIESVVDYKPVQNELTKVILFKFENLGSVSIDGSQQGNNSSDADNGNTVPVLKPIYVEDGSQLIQVMIENPITGLIEPVYR